MPCVRPCSPRRDIDTPGLGGGRRGRRCASRSARSRRNCSPPTFPALTDEAAVASTADLARRLAARALDREKSELLGAIQRVAADSTEGRGIRLRLRELDLERQRLAADV